MAPTWGWINWPHLKFLCSSYAQSLSVRDALKSRRLIQSDWYQDRWGDIVQLTGDQNAKQRYENTATGYRIASSVGGTVTGEGGDLLFCLPAGEIVSTPSGGVPIESLRPGDAVFSYDHLLEKAVEDRVVAVTVTSKDQIYELRSAEGHRLRCTADHPIFTKECGYIRADQVVLGMLLKCGRGQDSAVSGVAKIGGTQRPVYDIKVERCGNFFAGGILVHNCDDPLSMNDAWSDTVRQAANDWWDNVMSTRLNNPKTGGKIIIMQRGHMSDLAGHVLKQGGWCHLNLPAEYEGRKNKTVLGWQDPRTKIGELLCPARFGREEIEKLKGVLGPLGASAQLQQNPTQKEGGILKKKYFRLWPHDKPLPAFHFVVQSYDTAFTEKTENDPTACTVWGLFKHRGIWNIMLVDAWRDWLSYPDLRRKVRLDRAAKYGDGDNTKQADLILIEEKGSGITLLQDLRMIGVRGAPYNPNKADKVVRAVATTPFGNAGQIWLMESGKHPGECVSWSQPFLQECLAFGPAADYDDYVDTFSQAVLYFRNQGLLEAKVAAEDPDEAEEPDYGGEAANPYAA